MAALFQYTGRRLVKGPSRTQLVPQSVEVVLPLPPNPVTGSQTEADAGAWESATQSQYLY
jgi:hypothetical protein